MPAEAPSASVPPPRHHLFLSVLLQSWFARFPKRCTRPASTDVLHSRILRSHPSRQCRSCHKARLTIYSWIEFESALVWIDDLSWARPEYLTCFQRSTNHCTGLNYHSFTNHHTRIYHNSGTDNHSRGDIYVFCNPVAFCPSSMSKVFRVVGRQDGDVRTNCCARSNFNYTGIVEGAAFAYTDAIKDSRLYPYVHEKEDSMITPTPIWPLP